MAPKAPTEPETVLPGRLRFTHVTYSDEDGTRVISVAPGCAADLAGLTAGDLILAVDGTPVTYTHTAPDLVSTHSAGDVVVLTIRRADQTLDLTAELSPPGPAEAEYQGTLVEIGPDP